MAASYKYLFNRLNRFRKDDTAPIHLRVVNNRKIKYINTGINIKDGQWSEKEGGIIVKHRKAIELNKALRDLKNTVNLSLKFRFLHYYSVGYSTAKTAFFG